MSLTLALAVVGGLVLAGVIGHGAWTTRQAKPRAAEPLPDAGTEPSFDNGQRQEPGFDPTQPQDLGPDAPPPAPRASAARSTGPYANSALGQRRLPRLDGLIDAIATLRLDSPISGDQILAHLPTSRRAGTKPFYVEGLNAETGDWEAPMAGQRYGELQAGVQLANRLGALNEIEYSEFAQKVQTLAEAVGAAVDLPDMIHEVNRAKELDAFAGPYDAQLAVNLRAKGAAWSVGYIHQMSRRHGFVPGVVPGRLVIPATEEGAPPVLVLSFDPQAALAEDPSGAAVRDLVLSLDVPQTEEALEPFALWLECARALCNDMGAQLIDDRQEPITVHAFAAIGQDLQQIYRALQSRDLAAGSPAARRLFS